MHDYTASIDHRLRRNYLFKNCIIIFRENASDMNHNLIFPRFLLFEISIYYCNIYNYAAQL